MPPDLVQASQTLQGLKAHLQQLHQQASAEKQKKLQRWHDELPMVESYIAAMASTKEIIQKEQKQLKQELANVKEHLERQAAQFKPAAGAASADTAALQQQLAELRERLTTIDGELQQLQPLLAGGCRPEERPLYETKLVVLQDTRRLLQQEESQLQGELKRVESAARLAADQAAVEQLGWGDLGHLAEQLAGIEAKLDRAKVALYFPEVKGYRYAGGGNGVYCAAKELHVSEVSGSFALTLEKVAKADGSHATRLTVKLAGVSASDYSLSKQRSSSPRRSTANSMKAARLAAEKLQQETLARQKAQQQKLQQALARHSSEGTGLGAGGGSSMGGIPGVATSGGKRGAAVARFLGGLADKREQLAARLTKQQQQGAGEGGAAPRMGQLEPFRAEVRSSLSKLANTFADKRRLHSSSVDEEGAVPHTSFTEGTWHQQDWQHQHQQQQVQQQQQQQQQRGSFDKGAGASGVATQAADVQPQHASSASAGAASGVLIGTAVAAAATAAAAAAGQGQSPHPEEGNTAEQEVASGAAMRSAAPPQALAPPPSPALTASPAVTPSVPPAMQQQTQWVSTPPQPQQLHQQGSSPAPRHSGSGGGASSSGSSPQQPWTGPPGSSPGNRQQELKQRFAVGLGAMKGRFSNLMADIKEESKALVAESQAKTKQLLDESRAGAKHLLEDSKVLLAEGRTSAKHLLEESKQKLSEQKSNLQRHISRGSSTGTASPAVMSPTAGAGATSPLWPPQQQLPAASPLRAGVGVSPGVPPVVPLPPPVIGATGTQPLLDNASGPGGASSTGASEAAPAPAVAPAAAAAMAAAAAGVEAAGHGTSSQQQQQQQQQGERLPPGPMGEGVEPQPTMTAGAPFSSSPQGPAAAAGGGEGEGNGLRPSASGSSGAMGGSWNVLDEAAAGSSTARRGVYITLLAQQVEVLGEKGTKVPNISVKEIALEVEAQFSATFEYSPLLGWQAPAGLVFEVLELERRVEGANLPLPKALIKSLLNMIMPSVFTKLFLTSLPHELGAYMLEAGQGLSVAGELRCFGPPLTCLYAPLGLGPGDMPRGRGDVGRFVQDLRAAQKARAMLAVHDLQQAKALDLLLAPTSPYCLLPEPRPSCLTTLCWLYLSFRDSAVWQQLCEGWQAALDALAPTFDATTGECLLPGAGPTGDAAAAPGRTSSAGVAAAAAAAAAAARGASGGGMADGAGGVLNFRSLMEGPVAALCRKPVRVSLGLQQLEVGLLVEPALKAVREYCERVMREFEKNAKAEDRALLSQRSLAEQLEGLDLWHKALLLGLNRFSTQFRSAGCDVLAAADREGFQMGAEGAHYEGPLRLQVPLPVLLDAEEAFVFNIQLPNPKAAADSMAFKIRYILDQLMRAAFGQKARQAHLAALLDADAVPAPLLEPSTGGARASLDGAAAAAAGGFPVGGDNTSGIQAAAAAAAAGVGPSTGAAAAGSDAEPSPSRSSMDGAAAAELGRQASGRSSYDGQRGSWSGGEALLESPLIGKVTLRRLGFSLKLDEKRLSELLGGTAQDANLVSSLLGCFGNLFTTTLDTAWCQDPPDAASGAPGSEALRCVLRVANNDITRVRCDLESALFQSCLAPAITIRLLHAVALAVAHKLQQVSGKHLRWLDKVFQHLQEYCSKDSLDLLVCLHAGASVGPKGLAVNLSGKLGQATSASGGGGEGAAAKQPSAWPVYLINDFSMLTVLDTVKLMMDY